MNVLMLVEDRFAISDRGVALFPSIPLAHPKASTTCTVVIERPDGLEFPTLARFAVEHFRPIGYKLIIYLPEVEVDDVPIGSLIRED